MNRREHKRAISNFLTHLVFIPGYLVEIRGLGINEKGYPRALTAVCNNPYDAAGLALWMADKALAVYFTINPIATDSAIGKVAKRNKIHKPRRGEDRTPLEPSATSNEDIAYRRLMLIDIDPTRPEAFKHWCSTDGERAKAREVAGALWAWLKDRGWPKMTWVDSGNGLHGYVMLPPNTSGDEVETILRYLSWRFSTPDAHVDTSVGNAGRISRVAMTLNIKGEDSEDRPWRYARMLTCPEMEPVSASKSTPLSRRPENRSLVGKLPSAAS